ncbi:hypothetical protein IKF43_01535 [Candidatus Saccharibacteria bacterium]|nr:hypothetical protein [Candidatus Saccharibacteria bacterium]
MENYNFSPVDINDGTPIIPSTDLEEAKTDETISEEVGPTSDEHGYGTSETGDISRNDLDQSYYNAQIGNRVNDLYAQEEAELEKENAAFEEEWDKESEAKLAEQKERYEAKREAMFKRSMAELRAAFADMNKHLEKIDEILAEDQKRVEEIEKNKLTSQKNNPRAQSENKLTNQTPGTTYVNSQGDRFETPEEAKSSELDNDWRIAK